MNLFDYVRNKLEERRARIEQESPADRAVRVTANATFWMAIFTFVLMLVGIGTVLLLIEGGVDTHALAQASEDAAHAASDQADAAQQFSDTAEDINNGISDATAQLEAAAENTRVTIRNAQATFKEQQRAWVGVQDVIADPQSFTETEPWKVKVVFFNSGRTPARKVQISGLAVSSSVAITRPPLELVNGLTFQQAQSIAPQASYREAIGSDYAAEGHTSFQMRGMQALVSKYKLIKSKQLFLYYFGILKYDDGFGKTRETQYCILLGDPDTKEAGFCDEFNDLN